MYIYVCVSKYINVCVCMRICAYKRVNDYTRIPFHNCQERTPSELSQLPVLNALLCRRAPPSSSLL